jgi:hypothetical protein
VSNSFIFSSSSSGYQTPFGILPGPTGAFLDPFGALPGKTYFFLLSFLGIGPEGGEALSSHHIWTFFGSFEPPRVALLGPSRARHGPITKSRATPLLFCLGFFRSVARGPILHEQGAVMMQVLTREITKTHLPVNQL